jgi:hypothetical protein
VERERVGLVLVGRPEIDEFQSRIDEIVADDVGHSNALTYAFNLGRYGFGVPVFQTLLSAPALDLQTLALASPLFVAQSGYFLRRALLTEDWGYNRYRREMTAFLDRQSQQPWIHSSWNTRLPEDVVDFFRSPEERNRWEADSRILNHRFGSFHMDNLLQTILPTGYPRINPRQTGPRENRYVLADQVLFRDEGSEEPVMVVFLRTQRQRPVYPAVSRSRSWSAAALLRALGIATPATIPAE